MVQPCVPTDTLWSTVLITLSTKHKINAVFSIISVRIKQQSQVETTSIIVGLPTVIPVATSNMCHLCVLFSNGIREQNVTWQGQFYMKHGNDIATCIEKTISTYLRKSKRSSIRNINHRITAVISRAFRWLS